MEKAVLVVLSSCTDPSREEEFNTWYDSVHLPDVLQVPHVIGAKRYEITNAGEAATPKFLAIYALDTEDTESVMATLREYSARWASAGRMIDCLKVESGYTYVKVTDRS